ncbi:hypothetical protein FRC05_003882 [Tulasnella sp. 425]|nr:hypothetical protein FRC05_003882 [Tulasnella sp. 425]
MSQTTPPAAPSPSQLPQQNLPSSARPSDSPSHPRNPAANPSLFDPLPLDSPSTTQSSTRPSALPSHLSSESRSTRAITSADRSTVHSPTQKGAPWHPGGALNVKNEDDDASLAAPGLSPTSPIAAPVHHAQPQHHYSQPSHHQPHQYAYVPESVQFYSQAAPPPPQGPSGAPLSPQGAYPTQQPSHYAYHPHQPPPFPRNAPQHQYHYQEQQPQPQSPSSPHSPGDPRCDCRDCSNGAVMGSQPFSAQGMEFANRATQPYQWSPPSHNPSMGSDTLAGPNWMEQPLHRPREPSISDRQTGWHEPQGMIGPSSAPLRPQHVGVPGMSSQAYSGERASYSGDVPRWPNSQFGYSAHPTHMYPGPYPPPGPGPSSTSMSPTGSSVSWAVPQDPSSPDGPPSPSEHKSDKPVKHKSRKTWTEVEWKKLTDLAERSRGGDPNADIDWDYVTAGFGGRRCRQGILTVAAKRGLKVSTREARTIGKRARSAEEGD